MVSGYAAAAPRLTPLHRPTMSTHRNSFGHHSMPAMSLPTSSPRLLHAPPSHVPRITTEPPQLQSPFMSPPPPVPYEYSASASPREAKSVLTDAGFDTRYGIELEQPTWMQERAAIDPVLSQWDYFPGEELANSTLNNDVPGQFVHLSEIEVGRSQCYLGCSSSSADMCRRDHAFHNG
ncbi:hypothetical protein BDU57DRAFT_512655 [Ampelomyces quisqualis]|uniref:Uncharacterized protein n=1 Tax=Ampelomyces quisqualis TaxID=50730 RepID=A0A6A5R085_AMPQU|nr:hypothetical protein BDU57DRAFT_512655 [Ampelomyces quisqualis]